MSRINELKKQNPFLTIDGIDIITDLVGKSKYTEMMVNLIKNDRMKEFDSESRRKDYEYELKEFGYDEETIKNLDTTELMRRIMFMNHYIGHSNFRMFKDFIDLNERNLISQNDVTKYKTFRDVELQISLSELKNMDKELSKQTHKLYEDNEWLVVKPMSYQASLKYGASTKWCTASRENSDYYLRYSRKGILIYCINKITGDKVGAFKSLEQYEKETSFWDIVDQRIDSMESGLPNVVMDVIKKEFKEQVKSNFELLSDEERNRQLMELEGRYLKYSEGEQPQPTEQEVIPRFRNVARLVPRRARNIEETVTEQITEDISEDIINQLRRLVNTENQDEIVDGYDYPNQAG